MIKLIAADLDGTLLNAQKALSPETIRVIKQVKARGIEVVLSTGRTYAAIKSIYQTLELDGPVITNNGALVYHPPTEQILEGKSIEPSILVSLLDWLDSRGIYNQYYTKETVYTRELGFLTKEWAEKNAALPEDRQIKIHLTGMGPLPEEIYSEPFYKLLVMDTNPDVLIAVREYVENIPELETTISIENGVDILPAGINKGLGLQMLANRLNIDAAEIMAFGDQENDIEMLKFSGLSVAMDNASDNVKAFAKDIAMHHDNDGLAEYLKKYFSLE